MKELWVPISGAIARQKEVETIANNVANANTPGFKKDKLVFKEYITALDKGYAQDIDLPNKEWKPSDFYRSYGAENAQVKIDGSYTIHSQGQLAPTSNKLDFAINGKGFFEVEGKNGVRYTRNGQFTLNNEGFLVTTEGDFVLRAQDLSKLEETGEGSENTKLESPEARKIQFKENGNITVNLQGEIYSNGEKAGALSISEFKDIHSLRKEGSAKYINISSDNVKTNHKSAVHQGFIEQSNVNALTEMADLIKANRNFEAIQRAIKTYDNITGKGVNEISKL